MFAAASRFLLLAVLAVPALAASSPSPAPVPPTRVQRRAGSDVPAFNPTDIVPSPLPTTAADAHPGLTNAQRLARGLPPRSPLLNTRRRALAARQSPTPCALTQATGVIQFTGTAGNNPRYVYKNTNSFGEFQPTTEAADALVVVLRRCESNDVPFSIESLNSNVPTYPFVGAVTGYANTGNNLGPGSANYAYFAGTSDVPYGPAVIAPNAFSAATNLPAGVESHIWTLADNGVLTPHWVNDDGSEAATSVVYVPAENAFVLTGDVNEFRANYGAATPVAFTFVPNVPAP